MWRFSNRVAILLVAVIPCVVSAQSRRTSEPTSRPVAVDLKDPDALKAAMGSEVIVSGTVASAEWSPTGSVMRIEFNGAEKSRFYAVLFPKQRPAFDQKYGGDIAKALGGAEVRITGKLQLYRSRPEIIINRLDQLEVTKETGSHVSG
jgi:DNA/RNA endonuclease YhcR with UshA esterase domain